MCLKPKHVLSWWWCHDLLVKCRPIISVVCLFTHLIYCIICLPLVNLLILSKKQDYKSCYKSLTLYGPHKNKKNYHTCALVKINLDFGISCLQRWHFGWGWCQNVFKKFSSPVEHLLKEFQDRPFRVRYVCVQEEVLAWQWCVCVGVGGIWKH